MAQVVAKIDRSLYKTILSDGRHEIIADEPEGIGTDLGPSPWELLLMSLGACIAMTLRMYADRKEWPLEDVEVTLNHERILAKECEECTQTEGMVLVINKQIKITGDLDDTQKARILEIADKCPIHKALLNEVKMYSELTV